MILRPYQEKLELDIFNAWRTNKNVLAVMPTGAGKTVSFSNIVRKYNGFSATIAHRQELVSQISVALARNEVMHRIIAPKNLIRWIIKLQVEECGRSFYNPSASAGVIGIDTLISRNKNEDEQLKQWASRVGLWIIDEAHHVLTDNKWGKGLKLFKNAYGLGVTATPGRADGRGLGAHADGVFHTLVQGPTMRELISQGFLCDYRIFAPPSDLCLDGEKLGSTGDWSHQQLKTAAKRSHIVGDVVSHYLQIAPGKQGVTFATDVETASDIAMQFRQQGIKAEVLHAKVKDILRTDIIRRFKNKQIQQIVNVDILGEGFDVPGIEVVSMARPTQSFSLYAQQFGRALRPLEGKQHAIIIDHVNNVDQTRGGHGLPDAPRKWSLDRRERRAKKKDDGLLPVRACQECTSIYVATSKQCPYCGHVHIPPERSKPEFVDGDLTELDLDTLRQMRGEVARIDIPAKALKEAMSQSNSPMVVNSAVKNHKERQAAQQLLRNSIAWWRGHQNSDDSTAYRLFYFTFGVDVLTAQTLSAREAEELSIKINKSIDAIVSNG